MTAILPSRPYDWLKRVPSSLLKMDGIPLTGFSPAFPWEELCAKLSQILEVSELKIHPSEFQWRNPEELLSGLNEPLSPLYIGLSSLNGSLCWLMSEKDLSLLMTLLLSEKTQSFDQIPSDFLQGFYHFLALETIHILSTLNFAKSYPPFIQKTKTALPQETSLCKDVSITIKGTTIWGRVVISPELLQEWKSRFAKQPFSTALQQSIAENLEIPVHLEAGRTVLKPSEWSQVSVGDFLVLDFCSIRPGEEGGRVMLTVNNIPIFRGRLKDGGIKILEHPLYQEASTSMAKKTHDDSFEEGEDSEFEFDEDQFDEDEDEHEDSGEYDEDHDEDDDENGIDHDDDSDNNHDHDENNYDQEHEAVETVTEADIDTIKGTKSSIPSTAKGTSELVKTKALSPEEIDLDIVVEVGRLQMSVKKLLELQPGNMLELNIRPEDGIDLTVNGKCIAKGELLLLGDALGVRILEIG